MMQNHEGRAIPENGWNIGAICSAGLTVAKNGDVEFPGHLFPEGNQIELPGGPRSFPSE